MENWQNDMIITEIWKKAFYDSQTGSELKVMMYPFLTLDNDTEVTHSEIKPDGRVKVYIETPDEKDGFHNAVCWLPEYKWESVFGYSEREITQFRTLIKNNAYLIIETLEQCEEALKLRAKMEATGTARLSGTPTYTLEESREQLEAIYQRG